MILLVYMTAPRTDTQPIFLTYRDILIRMGLNVSCLRSGTFDGARVFQGKTSGVCSFIEAGTNFC